VTTREKIYYPVAKVSDIGPGEMKYVEAGPNDEPICLINYEGEFYAMGDCCTHEYASLSDGEIVGDEIECPLHGGAFEITTGMPASFPVVVPNVMYDVKIEDDTILIGID
jgi:nitrite reductase/ring-hydroxylating ferredoxin subunit